MILRFLRSVIKLAGVLACGALSAGAANYILQTASGADIQQITARYSLILVRSLADRSQTVFLVSAVQPVTPQLTKQILSDPAVRLFESDADVDSPETKPTSPPITSLAALGTAITNRAPIQYFGAMVRSSYVQQPAAALIRLPDVLASYASGGGIVAVIDTGVDPDHPALKGALVPGYDFTRNQPGYAPETADLSQSTVAILDQSTVAILDGSQLPADFGHGTMVAGLIHLVAPIARIMPLKAFHADGSAQLSDIVRAIYFAVDNQAAVINMSFSSPNPSATLTNALQYAWSHGVVCVASVGNDGREVIVYPAGVPHTIGVASTTPLDRRSVFSNYGNYVRISAPGEALITTYPGNNYAGVWGTSFSTALVSGAIALLTQVNPKHPPAALMEALEHGHHLQMDDMGDARLDLYATVLYALSKH